MRYGVEGLFGLVWFGSLCRFVTLNRERGGFVIYYKRLEKGRITHKIFYRKGIGFSTIRWDELVLLMEGVNLNTRRRNSYNLEEKNY